MTTPRQSCSGNLYRCIKRRMGHSLRGAHCKGNVVLSGKQVMYKLPGTTGGLPGPKIVSRPLSEQSSSHRYRQHHSGCLYKQGRDHEIGPLVCPAMENPDMVLQETGNSQSPTHSWPAECDSRQIIQARPDHPNREVPPSRGLQVNMLPVAPASS